MGGWDCYCLVCGGPLVKFTLDSFLMFLSDNEYDVDKTRINQFKNKDYAWLNSLMIIREQGRPLTTTSSTYDGYGSFKVGGKKYLISSDLFGDKRDNQDRGMVVHKKCFEYIFKKFRVHLNYDAIIPFIGDKSMNTLLHKKYLEMAPYMEQYQNAAGIYLDGEEWLLQFKPDNIERINEIWQPILKG